MLSLLDDVWVKTEGDFKVFYCLVVTARFLFPPNLQFNVNFFQRSEYSICLQNIICGKFGETSQSRAHIEKCHPVREAMC